MSLRNNFLTPEDDDVVASIRSSDKQQDYPMKSAKTTAASKRQPTVTAADRWNTEPDRMPPHRTDDLLNREQGLLAFNERVLAQADGDQVPLLERLRYLTIVSSNLDEFFEIRVSGLHELAQVDDASAAEARASLDAISARVNRLVRRQYALLNDALIPQLAQEGIVFHAST
ncbi:MAG: hypothetical protein EBQ78_13650, partial [Betaproteobacteria bacterium]|nr:hypothetical protein [Betaproteobacteria bacterium]